MCELYIKQLQALQEENKRYRMKLVAVKILVEHEESICAKKLQQVLEECEGCYGKVD